MRCLKKIERFVLGFVYRTEVYELTLIEIRKNSEKIGTPTVRNVSKKILEF